ncbi:MAG: hypothetical protein EZS28_007366 [Streblomastix strix]|uniref:Uncharacterized protein n=1 Tax=Streblomastix strix TaxID=222440 RepID=A0A5J4WQD1_9EUKA|nr:MAG: hypothetical protein EZS28_007366 [Streblomastix strix]
MKSLFKDLLLRIVFPNSYSTIVIAIIIIVSDPVAASPPIFAPVQIQNLGAAQPPAQPPQPAYMGQQEQILNRQVIQPIADTIQRGRDMKSHQTHQKQIDVSLERSHPSPNINTLYIERSKGHFPPFEERMSKDLIQQHRTAWNLEGYDLVDQKSRRSDPHPAGYAEGFVQVWPFIETHNRQSDMRMHSSRSPGRRHDKDKND